MFATLSPDKYLADLKWAVASPSLLDTQANHGTSDWPVHAAVTPPTLLDWLDSVTAQAIAEHIARLQPRRLGHYFEALWQFVFTHYPGYELIAHNLQVIDGGHTLGEFDLLYYCHHRKQPVHVEMAIKFYLGQPDAIGDSPSRWLGPGCIDRLDIKLEKLLARQIQLAATRQGSLSLSELGATTGYPGLADNIQREIILKGVLFSPLSSPLAMPAEVDPEHLTGGWATRERFEQTFSNANHHTGEQWRLINKAEWLAPCDPDQAINPAGTLTDAIEQINQRFEKHAFPVMLARLSPGHLTELARYFIVPDGWPWSA